MAIVMGHFANPNPVLLAEELTQGIAEKLFPRTEDGMPDICDRIKEKVQLFTLEEMLTAAKSLKSGKAPGPDGIPPEAMKVAMETAPEWMLNVLNGLLLAEDFPLKWKLVRLLLIPAMDDPTAYRPLGLLSVISKL
ncbi:hypothetical protein JTB14_034736 [Gonioctena quinquepunctata]|nr:hypothetical protein JTB14_034736 [Gonioctena quinquepunctata]